MLYQLSYRGIFTDQDDGFLGRCPMVGEPIGIGAFAPVQTFLSALVLLVLVTLYASQWNGG